MATNPRVYFKVESATYDNDKGGSWEALGVMVMELRQDIAPRTVENFLRLCVGGHTKANSQRPLGYKKTLFHRIVPNLCCQGGDVSPMMDGSGGECAFGSSTVFEDENFVLKHTEIGTLAMSNTGKPNSNSSQFFFTLRENIEHLDGKHVVFGKIVEGIEVLKKIETYVCYIFALP